MIWANELSNGSSGPHDRCVKFSRPVRMSRRAGMQGSEVGLVELPLADPLWSVPVSLVHRSVASHAPSVKAFCSMAADAITERWPLQSHCRRWVFVVKAALGTDGRSHGTEKMPAVRTTHINREAGLDPALHQPPRRGPAVPHLQFDIW